MRNKIGCIATGVQFIFGRDAYVRIPEMILQCGEVGFVVNAIRIEQSPNYYVSPKFIAEFFCNETVVEVKER